MGTMNIHSRKGDDRHQHRRRICHRIAKCGIARVTYAFTRGQAERRRSTAIIYQGRSAQKQARAADIARVTTASTSGQAER